MFFHYFVVIFFNSIFLLLCLNLPLNHLWVFNPSFDYFVLVFLDEVCRSLSLWVCLILILVSHHSSCWDENHQITCTEAHRMLLLLSGLNFQVKPWQNSHLVCLTGKSQISAMSPTSRGVWFEKPAESFSSAGSVWLIPWLNFLYMFCFFLFSREPLRPPRCHRLHQHNHRRDPGGESSGLRHLSPKADAQVRQCWAHGHRRRWVLRDLCTLKLDGNSNPTSNVRFIGKKSIFKDLYLVSRKRKVFKKLMYVEKSVILCDYITQHSL